MLAVTIYSLGNSSSITVSLNELLCLFSGPRFSVRQMHMVQLFYYTQQRNGLRVLISANLV